MSKIKLEAGMRMKCTFLGSGHISHIRKGNISFPIKLSLDGGSNYDFTKEGRYLLSSNPTLKLLNIPFTEGLEVECDIYGSGVVYAVNPDTDTMLSILVQLADGRFIHYTLDGRIDLKANQTLFPKFTI